jgi:hypothetical protein
MSEIVQYTVLSLFVMLCGVGFAGIGVAVNRWESAQARKQFTLLAQQYHGTVQDARPFFGAAPISVSGTYQGQPFTVETRITSGGRVNIGGINTPVQAVVTRVQLGTAERWVPHYMKSPRQRRKVEAALAELASGL